VFEDVARVAETAATDETDVSDRVAGLFPNPSPSVHGLMATAAGTSFEGGIYRLLELDEVEPFVAACERLVPESAGAVRCFGCDWLGRPWGYSMDAEDEVFVIEPYSGEMLVTTATVATLHRDTFREIGGQLMEIKLWKKWRKRHPAPAPDQCAGFVVPQFLGGDISIKNLAMFDRDVYWELCTQLIDNIADVAPGTPITSIQLR
jgi:hypothetical protein